MRRPDGTTFIHDCDTAGCWIKLHAAPFNLLADAFGGAIRPTDIDGQVERQGYFLTFEWKQRGGGIPQGQDIMFKNQTRLLHFESNQPACTVFVVWHEPGMPHEVYQLCVYRRGIKGPELQANIEYLWNQCFEWYAQIEPGWAPRKATVHQRFLDKLASMGGR